MRGGLVLVGAGLASGALAAFGATRWVEGFLFGITTRDPLSYAVAALALAVPTLLACWLPARRATRLQPTEALRREG